MDSIDDPTAVTSSWQFLLLELSGSHYAAICTEKHGALDGRTPLYNYYKKIQIPDAK